MNYKRLSCLIAGFFCALLMSAAPPVHAINLEATAVPRWELTIGTHASRGADNSRTAVPKAELEYQWRERVRLTSAMSWPVMRPASEPARSGAGMGEIGAKLLFWDVPSANFSMELCPQMARYVNASSVRRGLASGQREFALPVETKLTAAGIELELKVGRTFIESAPDEWTMELKATQSCLPRMDCTITIERNFVPMEPPRLLVMPGVDWKFNDSISLKTLVGRDVGRRTADRQALAINLELKIAY